MTVPALAQQLPGVGTVTADNMNTWVQGGALLADLQGFIGLSFMTVYMIGGAAVNDGLQGLFYWNSSWTGTPDNINSIQPSGLLQGAWLRIPVGGYDLPTNLPTTLPALPGVWWNNGGVVSISGTYP